MKNKYEKRLEDKELRLQNVEVRADENEGKMIVEGYPCVFEQETLIGDEYWGWYEKIDRHAFDGCDFKDAALKYNHGDAKGILARVKNGSMQLSIDEYGLKMRAELIDTTDNVDIYKCIKSGLLDKMSFAFTVEKQEWDESRTPVLRTITKIDKLWDCAVVDVPAYEGTNIYARSKEIVEARLTKSKPSVESDEVSVESDNKKIEELNIRKRKFRFKNNIAKEDIAE